MPIKSNQSWRDSDNFREQFFQSVDTAVGILSYLGTGGTAADFPLPATAFDSSFAASQSAFWFDCRNLEPTAWNPNKIWGLPLPRKKKTEPLKFTFCSLKPQPLQNDIHNYPMILSQSKTHMLLEY